jgi:hypothetical protein
MIAIIIWKIRKGLLHERESVDSIQYVIQLARKMYRCFVALVSSFLDPKFKFGPGFSDHDKQYIWGIIR